MTDTHQPDNRIPIYIQATHDMRQGQYNLELPVEPPDDVGQLGRSLVDLGHALEARRRELLKLDVITGNINAGLLLDDILAAVYDDFREIIPYNRIGFSLIENDGRTVRARWARSDRPTMYLTRGYSAQLAGSSLQTIVDTGQPRILNDLAAYLEQKPESDATRRVVAEGMRSSLTCPLMVNGFPIGFMFFSSVEPHTYSVEHVQMFQRIARQLSIIVDKGQLVSELAERKAEIEAQNEQLRQLNEMKDTFLGIAAHDLRNPISSILMIAHVLMDEEFILAPEQRAKFMDDIARQSQHMLVLLEDLLDVSQIESGKLDLHSEYIGTFDFLREAVERHRQLALPKGTQIEFDCAAAGTLWADPTRLRQVIDNLISNAVKYSPPGSTVWVSCQHEDRGWLLSVRDQGPGITEKDRQKLFQDFARLSARPTGGESSTGLGLAITRRIVQAHGGELGADSVPGQGATFWVRLPDMLA